MNDRFTENIKHRMATHTMAEPEGLWQNIEHQLDAAPHRRSGMAVPLWVRRASIAAAAALVLGVLAYVFILGVEHDMDMRVQQIAINEQPEQKASQTTSPTLAQNSADGDAESSNHYRAARVALNMAKAASSLIEEQKTEQQKQSAANPNNESVSLENNNATDENAAKQSSTSDATGTRRTANQGNTSNEAYNLIAYTAKPKGKRLSAGIYTSGITTSNETSLSSSYFLVQDMMNTSSNTNTFKYNSSMKMHHSMPLNVGVKVRYNITRQLFAETGVSYSYLRSHGDDTQSSHQQRLHYIGVPIDLGFTVWSNKRMKAYVKGGGEMQKLVSGRHTITYNVMQPFTETQKISERGMQWSVDAGVGFEVEALPKLSIYVEPSVKHYFDNDSNIDNIYKDKPTNFSLQVGLRFNP
ncbi:MAG: outer membrane beta-barrel protein [Muribaculaceae bacterium]